MIGAGSLLGVALKRDAISFPVGKVNRVQMYPMSFYEFVLADGGRQCIEGVSKYPLDRELPEIYTGALEKYLRHYYIVGGMPEVVLKWVETHRFDEVDALQGNIIQDYSDDFTKHAPLSDIPKLGWIWDSIPKQLAKENNKFIFSHVKEGKRSKELEDALEWLKDAGLVYKLELVAKPEIPLSFVADAMYFKVYMSDVGLLRKKSGVSYKTILEDTEAYRNFKGALTENYCLSELIQQGINAYFWRSGNSAELDFVFESDNRVIPMEAKAEIHTKAKSYVQFCKKYHPKLGFKCSMKNAALNDVEGTVTYSLPLYLIWRLKDLTT